MAYRATHTAVSEGQPKLTLHWIACSRAQRIVWLLEELKLNYLVKPYCYVTEDFRGPTEIKLVHPLGRVPVLEVQLGSDTKMIAESGHIINYLLQHFDHENLLTPETQEDCDLVDYFLHFAEATLHGPVTLSLTLDSAKTKLPWYAKPFVASYVNMIKRTICIPNVMESVKLIETHLRHKSVDGKELYLVGEKFSGADIMLGWSFTQSLPNPDVWSNGFDMEHFPYISKWIKGLKARPGYLRTLEKEKQLGNELSLKRGIPAKL